MKSPNDISQLPDKKLVERYQQNHDAQIVGELFTRHTAFVFAVCMKYYKNEDKSKDAVMQIFEKLIQDLKKHTVKVFKPWLYSVAKNHCLVELRSKSRNQKKHQRWEKDNQIFMENTPQWHLSNENQTETQLQNLEKGIEQLGDEQKKCIKLFYLQEKSYKQVAEITGYSLKKVKSYIQNGKRNLKNFLAQPHIATHNLKEIN